MKPEAHDGQPKNAMPRRAIVSPIAHQTVIPLESCADQSRWDRRSPTIFRRTSLSFGSLVPAAGPKLPVNGLQRPGMNTDEEKTKTLPDGCSSVKAIGRGFA